MFLGFVHIVLVKKTCLKLNLNLHRFNQGGLAATFDLAAFRKLMIAPVKKSVNHSKTVTSMREMRRIHVLFCPWRLDGGKRSRI